MTTKMPRREHSQEAFPAEGLLSWVIKEEQEFSRWDLGCGREGGFLRGCVLLAQWIEDPPHGPFLIA